MYLDWYLLENTESVVSGLILTWRIQRVLYLDWYYLTNTECCICIDTYLMNTESFVSGLIILTWRIQSVVSGLILTSWIQRVVYLDWYLLDEYRVCCIWIDTYLMNTESVVSGLILIWRIERVFERNETKIHVQLFYILGFMVHVKLINIVMVQTKLCVIYIGMSRFTNMVFTTILITGKCTIKNNWDNFIFSIKIDYFNRACHIFDSKYMISHLKAKVLKNKPKKIEIK